MKTDAYHEHNGGVQCWYDSSLNEWFTYATNSGHHQTFGLNVKCPGGKIMFEAGDRTKPLIAGDESYPRSESR